MLEITAEKVKAEQRRISTTRAKRRSRARYIFSGTTSSLNLNLLLAAGYLCDGTWSVAGTELDHAS
jgi:hypothetical protein